MGEGWSDFYALCLLSEPGDDPNGTYAAGAYASYQLGGLDGELLLRHPALSVFHRPGEESAHLQGHRSRPGERPPGHSAKARSVGGSADEVHNLGEVWCVTLWEARASLIAKHGAAAGNELILQLVTDGMKLAPANPNFLQARDAILQAELVNTGGANRNELWAAFAKRGLGAGASSPASNTTAGLVESFDLPDTLSVTPSALAVASGSIGGPFTPSSFTFSLYNSDTAALPWTVTSSEGWLTFPQTGGTLAAGATLQLNASLNATAAALPAGPARHHDHLHQPCKRHLADADGDLAGGLSVFPGFRG